MGGKSRAELEARLKEVEARLEEISNATSYVPAELDALRDEAIAIERDLGIPPRIERGYGKLGLSGAETPTARRTDIEYPTIAVPDPAGSGTVDPEEFNFEETPNAKRERWMAEQGPKAHGMHPDYYGSEDHLRKIKRLESTDFGPILKALAPVAVAGLVIAGVVRASSAPSSQTDGAPLSTFAPATAAATAPAGGAGAGQYGPLKVTRGQGSSISLYQLAATGPLPPSAVKWSLDAPCGAIAPLTASAQVSWSNSDNTKTCPPPGGPYPGTVKVTFTASDGKTYTWTAGSESGTYGETVTVR